jgi:GT2 family glycosyltransferase
MKPSLGVVMVYIGNVEMTLNAIKTLIYTSRNCFNVNLFLFKNGPSRDGQCIDEDYLMSLQTNEFKIHYIKFPANVGIIRPRNIGCEMTLQMGCEYCLILDNDVLLGDPWPLLCYKVMETHDIVGHYHCRMNFSSKRTDPLWFCVSYPMPHSNAFYITDAVATCFLF